MKRLSLFAALVTMFALIPLSAAAARVDGAAFAADCNDDGVVNVSGNLAVLGGSGVLTRDCLVTIDDFSRLAFRDTSISGSGYLIVGDSGEGSVVAVVRSTIDVSGAIQLSAGCCSGGEEPETDGRVRVVDSTVHSGSTLEISASVATQNGRVAVRRSDISGVGAVVLNTFDNGVTIARENTITSGDSITIRSGSGSPGLTRAIDNIFGAPSVLITATGGTCRSVGNSPAVACS